MGEKEVKSEIERYIVAPGQACAYKIGMLKIQELRERARKELGDKFDQREFHDAVLKNGALPLEILEEQVDDYIQRKKASASQTAEQSHSRARENGSCSNRRMHVCEVRPRRGHRGFDLISDALPFGRLWYTKPDDAIGYAEHRSRSHHAVIRVYDEAGNVIENHEHAGDFKEAL